MNILHNKLGVHTASSSQGVASLQHRECLQAVCQLIQKTLQHLLHASRIYFMTKSLQDRLQSFMLTGGCILRLLLWKTGQLQCGCRHLLQAWSAAGSKQVEAEAGACWGAAALACCSRELGMCAHGLGDRKDGWGSCRGGFMSCIGGVGSCRGDLGGRGGAVPLCRCGFGCCRGGMAGVCKVGCSGSCLRCWGRDDSRSGPSL